MIKVVKYLVLCSLLAFISISVSAFANHLLEPTVSISVSKSQVSPGETFTVTLTVKNTGTGHGYDTGGVHIDIDKGQITSISRGSFNSCTSGFDSGRNWAECYIIGSLSTITLPMGSSRTSSYAIRAPSVSQSTTINIRYRSWIRNVQGWIYRDPNDPDWPDGSTKDPNAKYFMNWATKPASVQVVVPNNPPTANPNGPYSGEVNKPIQFYGSGSDPDGDSIAEYYWTFGDGGTSSAQNPTHSYSSAGTYTATLKVKDSRGFWSQTASTNVNVIVPNRPPTANAGPDKTCNINIACSFSGTGSDPDGDPITFSWNFGDGKTASGASVTHMYIAAGTYTVTLTVTDSKGASSSDTAIATVQTTCNNGIKDGDEVGVDCGGSCGACGACIPLVKNGDPGKKINVVFVPDTDYNSDYELFVKHAEEIVENAFKVKKPISDNMDKFNFYYVKINGDARAENDVCKVVVPIVDVGRVCSFEEKNYAVIHRNKIATKDRTDIDCANGKYFSILYNNYYAAIHEAGHATFALWDEYYYEDGSRPSAIEDLTNVWVSEDACKKDRDDEKWAANCEKICASPLPGAKCVEYWRLSGPSIMKDYGFDKPFNEAGVRKINWVFSQHE